VQAVLHGSPHALVTARALSADAKRTSQACWRRSDGFVIEELGFDERRCGYLSVSCTVSISHRFAVNGAGTL
jgi:hypothetical protein